MKNSLLNIIVLLSLCLLSINASASKHKGLKYDSLSCLRIEGKITNADEINGEFTVEIIGLNDQIDTIILKEGKTKFKSILKKDSYYAIRVSKAGYLSKLVCVNTEILTETNGIFVFEFETTLIKEEAANRLNKDILDFPVAIIHFDYEKDSFSYNKEYSAYIKKELHTAKPTHSKQAKKETLTPLTSNKTFASASN